MRKMYVAIAGAALLVASLAFGQTNYPIDDFEILPFNTFQQGVGTVTDIHAVPPPATGHIISSTRRVTTTVFAGTSTASANLTTSGLDDAVSLSVPFDAQVSFVYPLSGAGIDLTASGTVDRIEMDVQRVWPAAAQVSCVLRDVSGPGQLVARDIVNQGAFEVVTWSLSSFGAVDVEDVTEIAFHFPDANGYNIREIRLRGTSSTEINYVLHVETAITPPLPSPPVEVEVLDDGFSSLFDMEMAITQADAGFTPSLQWGWTAESSMAGETLHGLLDWNDPAPFDPTSLAFSIDVADAGAGFFPELYPPDPVHGPEGVTLVFPVRVSDSPGGNVLGTAEAWLTIDPGPDQAENALEFIDVMVQENFARRAWSTGFTVSFLLGAGSAGVETIWPILQTRLWIDWSASPVVDVEDVADIGRESTTLTAAPSVTQGGAEIRAPRAFAASDIVLVHDVGGRLLASLRPQAGARAVFWSGRDDAGRTMPAGVYFVHLQGAAGPSTRVVKTR